MVGGPSLVWRNALFPYVLIIGDFIDSTTVMHVNDFPGPISIPIPIHQRGLILLNVYY